MARNDRLRQHRIAHNWRQQDVADQLGIAVLTIQRWERGSQQPSAYYRVKLCALFGTSAQELGLIEDFQSLSESDVSDTEATPPGELQLWTVPYARNPHFTGREELLQHLEQQFSPQPAEQPTTIRQVALTQAQAIKGLGGIGKTQTAVEYAYRTREQGRYTHTLWINAASEEAILNSFAALADFLPGLRTQRETDQRKLVATILHWLEQCLQPWLLIVDNADDISFIPPYLPRHGNGNLLITTRVHAVGALASSISIDTMSVLEGTHLLLRRAQRLTNASDDEINEAANLVMQLGQYPLALDQAGAYIEETGCSVSEYSQLLQQHRHALLARRGRQTTGYPDSIASTWSLSFRRVEQANPAATELLRLCSLLAPDHIPEELLTRGAAYWPAHLQRAVSDRFSFNEMLEPLLSFSLVKRLAEDHLLSLHRLVQAVQAEAMEPGERRRWAERIVCAVNAAFPRDPRNKAETWPECQRYLEQAQACSTLIQEHQLLLLEAGDLLNRMGAYLRERALYTLAEPLFQQSLQIREQLTGQEHPDVAETLHNLAILHFKQGRYGQAEPLYVRALGIREQQLTPEHLETAATLNELAVLYYQQEQYAKAEPLYLRALHIREQQLGSDHPLITSPLNNLGLLYHRLGRYEQTEALFLRALHIREKHLAPDHPDMANSFTILGLLYVRLGKYEQAEPLYWRALRIREQQLGPDHPDMVYTLINLANLYWEQGQFEQAGPLYLRALHVAERQGSEHLLVAYPLTGLIDLYREQGQFELAEQAGLRAVRIREQRLGLKHSQLAYPLHGLANLYYKLGKYEHAELLYLRTLHIREQQLGPDHLEVADVLYDFASFQQARGNTLEAISLYQRTLTIRKQTIGADHPLTDRARERLHTLQA